GGIDSAFLAHSLADTGRLRLWTIGIADAPEVEIARSAAGALGLPWGFHGIEREEVARALAQWGPLLGGLRGPARSAVVSLGLAISSAPSRPVIVTGQGADELFLGYAHFRGMGADAADERRRADIEKLDREDGPRLDRIAGGQGRKVISPFTHPALRAAATSWPTFEHLPRDLTKPLLREWARHRGMPEPILQRPKRAIQYGTGVDRLIRRLDRSPPELP
ncbi:asparagine synthetase, partial [mine drainage metagenome]